MPSLQAQLRNCPLDELLEVGLRCARQLQPLYRDWGESKPRDLVAIDDALTKSEVVLKTRQDDVSLEDLCEAAYQATGRAAAAYRRSGAADARLATFAGTAAYAIADAICDMSADPQTSRVNAMLAVDAAFKARKLIEPVEEGAAQPSQEG